MSKDTELKQIKFLNDVFLSLFRVVINLEIRIIHIGNNNEAKGLLPIAEAIKDIVNNGEKQIEELKKDFENEESESEIKQVKVLKGIFDSLFSVSITLKIQIAHLNNDKDLLSVAEMIKNTIENGEKHIEELEEEFEEEEKKK